MKNATLTSLLISLLLFAMNSHAGLYKGLDEEGNVVYSDTPFDNAQKITPPPITVIDAPKIKPKPKVVEEQKQPATKYKKFSITAPKNDQAIWNEPALTVTLQLSPSLAVTEGHTIWLMMDDKPLVKKSRSLILQIGRADRGTHKLQAQVRNKKGKIIKRTKTISVHIKNTVVRRAPR